MGSDQHRPSEPLFTGFIILFLAALSRLTGRLFAARKG
nr:MAG TPA: hypothetical protein [Caudoviricetes sp.]DAW56283.1 MAG TPA: hypothetical protein [Caudoviricetes sp.]